VRYSAGRRKLEEEKDEMRKDAMDVFYALARFCMKEQVSLSSA